MNKSIELQNDPLFTAEELSEFMGGPSPATLAVWRCRRFGPAFVKVGHLIRYRKSDALRFLEQRTVRPEVAAR
jgi:hypothetical protein